MGRRQKHGSVPSSNHRLDIRVKAEKGDPSGMLSQGTTSKSMEIWGQEGKNRRG